jgi:hypothetical protein
MTRVDVYRTVHKGIRATLFETAAAVGRTEFSDAQEAAAVATAVRRMLGFLDEHAEHEDAVLLPELARISPELFAEIEADHARTDGLQRELEGFVGRLEGANEAERVALGARLHDRVPKLVAEHLRHMGREETEVNRALWANLTDAELDALHQRVVGAIPPARMAEWLELFLPAVTRSERAALIGGLRASVPPPVFDALVAPARAALGPARWETTAAAAGI